MTNCFVSKSHVILHNTLMYSKISLHPISIFLPSFFYSNPLDTISQPNSHSSSHVTEWLTSAWGSLRRETTPPSGAVLCGRGDREGTVGGKLFMLPERRTFLFSFLDFIAPFLPPQRCLPPTQSHCEWVLNPSKC